MTGVKKKISSLLATYGDNVLGALRTAGGLLIGNSVLIYFKVLHTSVSFDGVANLGVVLILLGSTPIAALLKLFTKGE